MDTFSSSFFIEIFNHFLQLHSGRLHASAFIDEKRIIAISTNNIFIVAAIMLIIPVGVLVVGSSMHSIFPEKFSIGSVKKWLDQSSAGQWFIIELLIQLPFFVPDLSVFYKKNKSENNRPFMHKQQFNSYHADSACHGVRKETVESFQATIDEYTQTGFHCLI
jgi:hypothetical protein